jgi:hypothetical protein
MVIITSLGIIGIGIAGIYFSHNVEKTISKGKCTVFSSVGDLMLPS